MGGLVGHALKSKKLDKQDRVNLFYALEDKALSKSFADHIFLKYEGREWTFKETYDVVLKYATWLKATHAIAPKEIIALDYTNSPKFLFVILAIWSLGAHPAMINYNLTGKPLLHCIRMSTARVVLVDDEVLDTFTPEVKEALAGNDFRDDGKGPVEVVIHDSVLEDKVSFVTAVREPDSSRTGAGINTGDKMSSLIYTSGTTGMPKPAIGRYLNRSSCGVLIFLQSVGPNATVLHPLWPAT